MSPLHVSLIVIPRSRWRGTYLFRRVTPGAFTSLIEHAPFERVEDVEEKIIRGTVA